MEGLRLIQSTDTLVRVWLFSRIYCIVDSSHETEKRIRLCLLTSGLNGNAIEEGFDIRAVDPLKTIVMITEAEAEDIIQLFAQIEDKISDKYVPGLV